MERWEYNPNDENEPIMHLGFGDEQIEAHRGNTTLYTFMGRLAVYNHSFIRLDQDRGAYIFNFVNGYDQIAQYMMENNYRMYLNQTEVPQVDQDAYDRSIKELSSDIDHVPDEWS